MITPRKMREHCLEQQEFQKAPNAMVTFVIPGIPAGSKTHKRLFGRSGPLGLIVGTRGNDCMVAFEADKVIAALDRLWDKKP